MNVERKVVPLISIPDQLRALKPKESLVYYVGNLDADITRNNGEAILTGQRRLQTYADSLVRIKETAALLAATRKIRLDQKEVSVAGGIKAIKYIAYGLR